MIRSRPRSWERSHWWLAVLLVGSGYGDTMQMRHSMPQQAARADSLYSHIRRALAMLALPTCSMKPRPLASFAAAAALCPWRRAEVLGLSAPRGCALSRAPLGGKTPSEKVSYKLLSNQ